MEHTGWRTVAVETNAELALKDNCMVIRSAETASVPLSQIHTVIVSAAGGSISLPLLTALAERGITLITCGSKKTPVGELVGIPQHSSAAGRVLRQAGWTAANKAITWKTLVENKITNQRDALRLLGLDEPPELAEFLANVQEDDKTNREGQAARVYFSALFGHSFIRHSCDETNAALDYGYALLRSAVTRAAVAYGYYAALGIHHCSQYNSFNLSCDLMEPFRPMIDVAVYQSRNTPLDWALKRKLIEQMNAPCMIAGQRMSMINAIDVFVRKALDGVDAGGRIEEVRLCKATVSCL